MEDGPPTHAIAGGRRAEALAEEGGEVADVVVADTGGDLLDGEVAVEQLLGRGVEAGLGEVLEDRLAGRLDEQPLDMAIAELHLGGHVAHADRAGKVVAKVGD